MAWGLIGWSAYEERWKRVLKNVFFKFFEVRSFSSNLRKMSYFGNHLTQSNMKKIKKYFLKNVFCRTKINFTKFNLIRRKIHIILEVVKLFIYICMIIVVFA